MHDYNVSVNSLLLEMATTLKVESVCSRRWDVFLKRYEQNGDVNTFFLEHLKESVLAFIAKNWNILPKEEKESLTKWDRQYTVPLLDAMHSRGR